MVGDLKYKLHPVRLNPILARCFLPSGTVMKSSVSHPTLQLGQLPVEKEGCHKTSYFHRHEAIGALPCCEMSSLMRCSAA